MPRRPQSWHRRWRRKRLHFRRNSGVYGGSGGLSDGQLELTEFPTSKSRTQKKKNCDPKNSLSSGVESEQTLLTWFKPCIVCGHPFFNWFSYEGLIVPMFFSVVSISYVRTYSHTYIMNVCNIKMRV